MLIIPAIDLKDGLCVRLRQGLMEDATVFSGEPEAVALDWLAQGAQKLHLVDLNGAFAGRPVNRGAIAAILSVAGHKIPIQIGGGIRDLETIEQYLHQGISEVIIGTAAIKKPDFVREACRLFPGHVWVGLDAREGKVAVDGWANVTQHVVADCAQRFQDEGASAIVYTDIGRDGMLTGVNVESTVVLAQQLDIPVIASGGVTSLEDIRQLLRVSDAGIAGVIVGRALYEGTLQFAEAQQLVMEHLST